MSIINLIKTSIYSLKSHKLRVFLTMIGIIIGISSVVTILSIGDGLKAKVNSTVEDTNSNKINIRFIPENYDMDMSLVQPFSQSDIYDIAKIEGVQKAEQSKGMGGGFNFSASEARYFDKSTFVVFDGYKDEKLDIELGRTFDDNDENKKCIILDCEVSKQLFKNGENPIGRGVTIDGLTYEVIGVLKKASDFSLTGGMSYVPQKIKENMNKKDFIDSLDIYVKPGFENKKVFDDVNEYLKKAHGKLDGKYEMEDPQAVTKAFEQIIGGLTAFVALVTGISLFVGGIGVMNIMYVSVSERKREIGIRRAIGAKPNSILLQFLFESILVTGLGGLIGILFGFLFSKLIGVFLPFAPILTAKSFIGATLTSVIVGIVFGMIPAYNASRLDPIKAIYK
ncbi:ABC transporter permease [Clostridium ihumii]|uniref:ABC transporter permease n=1 Tax=Clostridium ihumii TaxID=1470356 RepID=UPI00058FF163|nr:ABC transporter permease [Clostridium ihumii]